MRVIVNELASPDPLAFAGVVLKLLDLSWSDLKRLESSIFVKIVDF